MLKAMLIFVSSILMAQAVVGQDGEKPTVAILRFGPHATYSLVELTLFDALQATGLIDAEEQAILQQGNALDGKNINVIWGDANFDFANTILVVEQAIDSGANALITFSTPITQAATSITSEMDDPPVVIFTSVFNPVEAGIAQSTCIKPDHITGIELLTPYEEIIPLLLLQKPDIQVIGTLYSSTETSGVEGAEKIAQAAEALGIEVQRAAVTSVADLALATEGLVENGVEALLIPSDMTTVSGLPIVMQVATENGVPVFHSVPMSIRDGATVGAGTMESALQGNLIAAILAGHLDGSLDVATTGIGLISNLVVNVNLDRAAAQDIEISQELLARADSVLEDGSVSSARLVRGLRSLGIDEDTIQMVREAVEAFQTGGGQEGEAADLPPQVRAIVARVLAHSSSESVVDVDAILESLHCTPEKIAEQQAAMAESE